MVSVVIATYRREQSLSNALASLVEQTYKDFEVVIVDDNADSSWNKKVEAIIAVFEPLLKIKYIQNSSNQGSAKTRNIGIAESNGEFITFLDDDDLYLPEKIEVQVKQMIKERSDYSLMNLSLYNDDETLSEVRNRDYLLTDESRDLMLCHLKYHMTGTDTMMFKRKYLSSFGGFEAIDVGDEFYLMTKAIEKNGRFSYCESCAVKAYVHTGDGGLSSGQQKIDGENSLYVFKKRFFPNLSLKNRRYIRMRHYAVLAFAFKRKGSFLRFIISGAFSFFSSPVQCLRLLKNLKR